MFQTEKKDKKRDTKTSTTTTTNNNNNTTSTTSTIIGTGTGTGTTTGTGTGTTTGTFKMAFAASAATKYLCLIRHGQGEHNPRKNPLALGFIPAMLKRDAKLTGKGKRQAENLQRPLEWMPFDLVLVSPLTRTIETATAAFADHPTPKRLCHLMCERATAPSDQGLPKPELLKRHPHIEQWQGWDELPEKFWPPLAAPKAAEEEVSSRVQVFKQWLLAREETCFALVGHSAFFRTMTGMDEKLANCEAFWCLLHGDGTITAAPELPPPPAANES